MFEYIELFYNATRRHSTLGMLSPIQFERISQPLNLLIKGTEDN